MRFKRNSTQNSEDNSAATSIETSNSFGIFDSDCSDFSGCQCGEDIKQTKSYSKTRTKSCATLCLQNAIDRETYPLLLGTKNNYKTLSSSTDTLGPAELSGKEIMATYQKTLERSVKFDKNKQSSLVTIFSIWSTIMGSSLLTMAWGVERAGLPAALLLLTVMAGLCLYTAYILIRVNAHHGSSTCEVPALCLLLLGRWWSRIAHAFSLLVLLGATLVYWLLMANFLFYTVNYFMDVSTSNQTTYDTNLVCPKHEVFMTSPQTPQDPSPYWGLHTTVPVYVALIMFPLLCFKNVTFFTRFTSFGTLSVMYLLLFVIVKGWMWGINLKSIDIKWEGLHGARNAAVLSGMLALSFYIHNIIITIMNNNARQEKNGRDLTIAFLLVTVTYTLVGTVFFICFPLEKNCIEDVMTVYPLVVCLVRAEAARLHSLASARGADLVINGSVVVACIVVACICPYIGTIIRYTGAVSGLVHVFALPSLLHMRSLQLRGKLNSIKIIFYFAIIMFGTVNLLMQFFIP
nr:sodium-coupled neutral amino acid transporter 9 homolog isoform X2 [Danaus plexippus plexippus]